MIDSAAAANGSSEQHDIFGRVAGFELATSESVLSALTTAVMIFLVIATAAAGFELWASGRGQQFSEADLIGLLLRALTLLSLLAATMAYMARTSG